MGSHPHGFTNSYANSSSHDDLLFLSQLTGFFALMRLGKLTVSDDKSLLDYRKITSRTSVSLSNDNYCFFLPSHKADKFFEGNIVFNQHHTGSIDPLHFFKKYLNSHDRLFPFSSDLWLKADGTRPSRSFFVCCMRLFFTDDIAGQSMRAGGATSLAENGVPPHWSLGFTGFSNLHQKKPCFVTSLVIRMGCA